MINFIKQLFGKKADSSAAYSERITQLVDAGSEGSRVDILYPLDRPMTVANYAPGPDGRPVEVEAKSLANGNSGTNKKPANTTTYRSNPIPQQDVDTICAEDESWESEKAVSSLRFSLIAEIERLRKSKKRHSHLVAELDKLEGKA